MSGFGYHIIKEFGGLEGEGCLHIVEGENNPGRFLCGLHYVLKGETGLTMAFSLGDNLPGGTYCTACHVEWSRRQVSYVHRN